MNCKAFFAGLIITSSVAITSTSFLFFIRVRAVYLQSRTITIIFGALWVVTASASIGFAALAARDVGQYQFSSSRTPYPTRSLSWQNMFHTVRTVPVPPSNKTPYRSRYHLCTTQWFFWRFLTVWLPTLWPRLTGALASCQ